MNIKEVLVNNLFDNCFCITVVQVLHQWCKSIKLHM